MHRPFTITLALLACTQCFGATVEEIAENATPSVVKIIKYDITGARIGSGSGFFVSPRKIMTNEHVVDGAYSAEVFTDKRSYDLITILKADEDMDLAILSVDAENEVSLQIHLGAKLKLGQPVLTLGYPLGLDKTLSDGLISAVRTSGQLQTIQITAPVSHGSSGSPLLDKDGRVIGVVRAIRDGGQNLNFAIGVNTLSQFLLMEESPQELKVARSRVLWRVVVRWFVMGFAIIVIVCGGTWFVIFTAFIIVTQSWHSNSLFFKKTLHLVTWLFGRRRRSASAADNGSRSQPDRSFTPSYDSDLEFDGDTVDEDGDINA
jgi:serine protease Do